MENEEQILKDAYKALPYDIKSIIGSSEWLKRVKEIAQKYSLSEDQINSLGYEILFTFLNLQSPDLLTETIREELDISNILAEQITQEIEERIFSWAMKKITPKEPGVTNTLDIPPSNLPGEVIGDEESASIPSPEPLFAKTQQRPLRDTVADFFAKPETTEAPLVEPTPAPKPEPTTPPSFISKKLSQPSTAPTQPRTPQSYTVDPYREPLN